METNRTESDGARARLGLWDATSIIVGIIIGVGIFETPKDVFSLAPGPWQAILVWVAGGALALVGALCFAELASTYPHSGGEYVYLTRAFGPVVGFLHGWAQLAVIRPATISGLAFVFADHAHKLVGGSIFFIAVLAVVVLTFVNVLGAVVSTSVQNLLTGAKVLGIVGIAGAGLIYYPVHVPAASVQVEAQPWWFAAAMMAALWSYAGWHETSYIAAEVRDPHRNVPLSLIVGTLSVTVIYVVFNLAILLATGFDVARSQKPIDIMQGDLGKTLNVLIMVSALGSVNGMIFTTAMLGTALGKDHRLFKSLSHRNRNGTPVRGMLIQGLLSVSYLVGAYCVNRLNSDSFLFWIILTAAVFYFFFLLSGLSVFVLRARDPHLVRPFRVPLYPVLPIIFCGSCIYLLCGVVLQFTELSFFGTLVLLAGLPLYFLPAKRRKAHSVQESEPLVGAGQRDKLSG